MTHYICLGTCRAVSEYPGVCTMPDCPKYEQALVECDCEDQQHFGRQDRPAGETDEISENVD